MVANRNFGLSGKYENTMAFHKLSNEQQIKKSRHGLNGNDTIHMVQSIGIINIDRRGITIQANGKNVETKAAARAIFADEWNSTI